MTTTSQVPGPARKRKAHLDASVIPVEKALLARAGQIGEHLDIVRRHARSRGLVVSQPLLATIAASVAEIVADEFRSLAEELHYS